MEKRAKSVGEDMRGGQPTPGNIAGGLSSIEEKSLGAIVKSGHRPIQGVLEYTDRVTDQKEMCIRDRNRVIVYENIFYPVLYLCLGTACGREKPQSGAEFADGQL